MWQKAKIKQTMLHEARLLGRYVWVRAAPPHDIQHLEPDGSTCCGRRAEMYDTNIVTKIGERGCFGVKKEWVELLSEFRERLKPVTYEQWMDGINGDENL